MQVTAEASQNSKGAARRACKMLSMQLRNTQIPLRILSHVAWDREHEASFHRRGRLTSKIDNLYPKRNLQFETTEKMREIEKFKHRTRRLLGDDSPVAHLMVGRAGDYQEVTRLLSSIGTKDFYPQSRTLWGSASDKLFSDGTTVLEYAKTLRKMIVRLVTPEQSLDDERVIPAPAVIELIKAHFRQVHLLENIDLQISDKIVANAAAGAGKIKFRKDALFSTRDIQVLIYHEAYTHVATGTNGRAQPYAKFLSFDSPRCTSTQEGLAVLMEIFSNSIYPQRLLKIADRVINVGMAEQGASPKEVYEHLRGLNYHKGESFQLMSRAFRGTDLSTGQAFTKDVAYLRGLIECFNFVQYCLTKNRTDCLPLLFSGKLALSEMGHVTAAHKEGFIKSPKWVPNPFQDLQTLSSWFICAGALGQMGDSAYHDRFKNILHHAPKV